MKSRSGQILRMLKWAVAGVIFAKAVSDEVLPASTRNAASNPSMQLSLEERTTSRSFSARVWQLLKDTVNAFIEDNALSRGASIAFYTVTSIGPVLVIVVAIAGLAFGEDAARNAISGQISGMMGKQSADVIQTAIASLSNRRAGILASLIGVITLLITASGVFGEIQATLNVIWKAQPKGTTVSQLIRARTLSLGLVAVLGFLLMVSLVISALLAALANVVNDYLPFGALILAVVNFVISYVFVAVLFGAIYKILPDRKLQWRDVVVGAVVTAALFTIGKSLIGLYIGRTALGSSYGAAGALLILLSWIYYSAQIFLLGAEFTKVYASNFGSQQARPLVETL